jgi:hypothetical protein
MRSRSSTGIGDDISGTELLCRDDSGSEGEGREELLVMACQLSVVTLVIAKHLGHCERSEAISYNILDRYAIFATLQWLAMTGQRVISIESKSASSSVTSGFGGCIFEGSSGVSNMKIFDCFKSLLSPLKSPPSRRTVFIKRGSMYVLFYQVCHIFEGFNLL